MHGRFAGAASKSARRRLTSCTARPPLRFKGVKHRPVSELARDAHGLLYSVMVERVSTIRVSGRDPRVSRCSPGDGGMMRVTHHRALRHGRTCFDHSRLWTGSPGLAMLARGWWNDARNASSSTPSWPGLSRPSTSCWTRSPGLARGWWNDARNASFHHLRDQEEVVLAYRRILDDVFRDTAIGHNVRAFFHRHGRHRGHWLDSLDVHLLQLLDKRKHGVEFAAKMLDFVLGDGDACEMCNTADSI